MQAIIHQRIIECFLDTQLLQFFPQQISKLAWSVNKMLVQLLLFEVCISICCDMIFICICSNTFWLKFFEHIAFGTFSHTIFLFRICCLNCVCKIVVSGFWVFWKTTILRSRGLPPNQIVISPFRAHCRSLRAPSMLQTWEYPSVWNRLGARPLGPQDTSGGPRRPLSGGLRIAPGPCIRIVVQNCCFGVFGFLRNNNS